MATLTQSNTYLNSLIGAGKDAMSNLFYVEFSGSAVPDALKLNSNLSVTYRCDSFEFQSPTQGNTSIDFLTETLNVPTPSFDVTKSITLNIRIDNNYQIYKDLLSLRKTISENESLAITDVSNDFTVRLFRATNDSVSEVTDLSETETNAWKELYKFNYCWISKVGQPTFDYSSSEAQVVPVEIHYFEYHVGL